MATATIANHTAYTTPPSTMSLPWLRVRRRWSLPVCVAVLTLATYPVCSGFSVESRPATRTTASSSDPASCNNLNVFLRLSPLIGGPRFLPLHLEVMLSDNGPSSSDDAAGLLHRFDFVPANPTDPKTLAQLLTLRSVPGLARYRTFDSSTSSSTTAATNYELNATAAQGANNNRDGSRIVEGRNGMTLRLTSIKASSADDASLIISALEKFTQQYQSERGDLNLIRNSCYTYAYELLRFLDTSTS